MTTTKKTGLGRGFDSLIPQNFDSSILVNQDERIQKIHIENIEPNPNQPRKNFDETSLAELTESIKTHGILLPLVVTPIEGEKFQIVAGERRFRAAKMAKLATVPAIVRTLKELERLEIALVENVQRVDLAPLEQAVTIESLHDQFSMTYDEIAKRLGKAVSTIANVVRLLQLPEKARQALASNKITEGHARAILALREYPDKQGHLLDSILKNSWTVSQAERYAVGVKAGFADNQSAKGRVQTETPLTKSLGKRLKTEVKIKRMAKGGRLEIRFVSDKDLERIIKLLG